MQLKLTLSGLVGASAVALGAMGAHSLNRFEGTGLGYDPWAWWNSASRYHLVHAAAGFALALYLAQTKSKAILLHAAWWSWLTGVVLFSGSLYYFVLTETNTLADDATHPLRYLTPIGGLCMILGWLLTAVGAFWVRSK
ncbi:MAG: DUF423 domain-containing protein [Planctomycetota bacterium]